ncbi:MAG: hypothetical protein JW750_05825 [Anaerolineaceae bacterium]|nr:hypothetical protein [Anaerolineaceae bacterium]
MTATDRIERLREHALNQIDAVSSGRPEMSYWAMRGWKASKDEPWMLLRRARETESILTHLTPVIDADELLVGKFRHDPLSPEQAVELARFQAENTLPKVMGQNAHMAVDYEKLLSLGVNGVKAEIEAYRSQLDCTVPEQLEQDVFYRGALITLDALVIASEHYADRAEELAAECVDENRKQELLEIAAVCRSVPRKPARTFYEAIQAAHFLTFALCAGHQAHLFQLGHPDRYLLPFYRADLKAGRITPETAQELIDCLGILLTEYTPKNLAVGWMLGGANVDGSDASNELTEMFLRSIDHVRMAYPSVGLAWTDSMPQAVKELAVSLLAEGHSHPAIFTDAVIQRGLRGLGLTPAESCLYQQSTCVEITPVASSNVYVASPYINLLQILHDEVGFEDESGVRPEELASFETLMAGYKRRLQQTVAAAVVQENTHQMTRRYQGGKPLLSCFVNDCLARGKDIDHGGARYNWIEPSFVGLSNLVDSLEVIRDQIFEQKTLTFEALRQTLRADYADDERLRMAFLNRCAKYGNDVDSVDSLAIQITDWVGEITSQYQTYLGGRFVSGFFCWIMHEQLGRNTIASADGRKAGFPLGDGSGPAQGREKLGPTAAILSSTKWDHSPHIGGIAVNLKFIPSKQRALFEERLLDLVETYTQRGGFELQVNVVDKEKLLAARAHPEQYRDLVVRIGGYSDYFVRLSPQMQDEIILRTEHGV